MDVVTLGETMVLMTPESTGLLRYATQFTRKFGGSESNFAIGLSRLGHSAGWISRVGDDEFGMSMLSFIRGEGIDVSGVIIDPSAPTGLYVKEYRNATDLRVYYYRNGSAASKLKPEDLHEEYISSAKYLFISGITPALSEECRETVLHAIHLARKNGVRVVFDPNLRKKLWDEEVAKRVLLEIAGYSDIILPGISEGEFLFDEKDPVRLGQLLLDKGCETVVIKLGAEGAYYTTNFESGFVKGLHVEKVVDPIGAGDGFAAGFISGVLDGLPMDQAVSRGNAVGAMVTMVSGDVEGLPDRADLDRFIQLPSEQVNR